MAICAIGIPFFGLFVLTPNYSHSISTVLLSDTFSRGGKQYSISLSAITSCTHFRKLCIFCHNYFPTLQLRMSMVTQVVCTSSSWLLKLVYHALFKTHVLVHGSLNIYGSQGSSSCLYPTHAHFYLQFCCTKFSDNASSLAFKIKSYEIQKSQNIKQLTNTCK